MKLSIKKITPKYATELLESNTSNRPLSEKTVDRYADDMRDGAWQANGDPIRISKSGVLLDGQHRLTALRKSGITISMVIIEGLNDEAFKTIDTGKKRNAADVLAIAGFHNPTITAAAARIVDIIKDKNTPVLYATLFRSRRMSNQECLNIITDMPGIADAVRVCNKFKFTRKLLSGGAVGDLYYVFALNDKELCEELFQGLETGQMLPSDSIILNLREKLLRELVETRKISLGDKIMLVIRVWNHLRKGERSLRLVIRNNEEIKAIL